MSVKKCIHVLALLDWHSSIADITVPLLRAYASKIGADLNLITQRRFPEWPAEFEKHQIFETGKSYDWNIHFNADILIHPDLDDITESHSRSEVGNWWYRDLRYYMDISGIPVFEQDGRFYGVDDALLVTSQATHHLWEPLPSQYELVKGRFKAPDPSLITLLSLSYNLAKFGYKTSGVLGNANEARVANLAELPNDARPLRERARAQMESWGLSVAGLAETENYPSACGAIALVNVAHGDIVARHLHTSSGIPASLVAGVDQGTLDSVSRLDGTNVLLLAAPADAACDAAHAEFIAAALTRTAHLKGGRALVTNLRASKSEISKRSAHQWGMKMTALAAQFDVALIDLDVLQSHHGDRYFYEGSGALKDTGAAVVAAYILGIVNHRNFSM